jgi:hypothetical protein
MVEPRDASGMATPLAGLYALDLQSQPSGRWVMEHMDSVDETHKGNHCHPLAQNCTSPKQG